LELLGGVEIVRSEYVLVAITCTKVVHGCAKTIYMESEVT